MQGLHLASSSAAAAAASCARGLAIRTSNGAPPRAVFVPRDGGLSKMVAGGLENREKEKKQPRGSSGRMVGVAATSSMLQQQQQQTAADDNDEVRFGFQSNEMIRSWN